MILQHKDTDVFYTDEGSGKAVILLHGFLEDHTMWKDISLDLVKTHRVITIDLLGHGRTGCLRAVHTMYDMAEVIETLLNHLNIQEVTLIGHSMGGYAALAFSEKNEEKVKALCLMNSTFEADSEELKIRRAKANKMVLDNFESMVRMSFANLFSESSKEAFKLEFESALKIALKTSVQGYIAAQEGMRLRKDQTTFFINAPFKKALLLGIEDAVLDSKRIAEFAESNNISVSIFSEGHMSHIENKTECTHSILHFIENI